MDSDLLDGLAEAVNIGAGHGASALSLLLGKRVELSVPKLWHGDLSEAVEAFDGDETEVFGFTFKIMGDISGASLLTMEAEGARRVLGLLWPEGGLTPHEELGLSGLSETAHIVSGAFLSAVANLLDMVAFQSIPRISSGPHSRVVREFVGRVGEAMFIGIRVEMRVQSPRPVRTDMIFVPSGVALRAMADKLKEMLS